MQVIEAEKMHLLEFYALWSKYMPCRIRDFIISKPNVPEELEAFAS